MHKVTSCLCLCCRCGCRCRFVETPGRQICSRCPAGTRQSVQSVNAFSHVLPDYELVSGPCLGPLIITEDNVSRLEGCADVRHIWMRLETTLVLMLRGPRQGPEPM